MDKSTETQEKEHLFFDTNHGIIESVDKINIRKKGLILWKKQITMHIQYI